MSDPSGTPSSPGLGTAVESTERTKPAEPAEPDVGSGVGGPGDDEGVGAGGEGPGAGLSWGRALVLAAALAFLGFAVGVFVSRDDPPGADSVDVGFYRDMIVHHQQAQSMATLELAHGEDATVRSYAREVLMFQSYEVGLMTQTLDDWGYTPQSPSDEVMAWMGMPTPADEMSGLASDAEMDELEAARGPESDALFLDLMAAHHEGGIHMAAYAAEHAGDAGVRELAGRMDRNQRQEISEYRVTARDRGYDIEI